MAIAGCRSTAANEIGVPLSVWSHSDSAEGTLMFLDTCSGPIYDAGEAGEDGRAALRDRRYPR